MELGYPEGTSFIHRLDPRVRIVTAVALSALLAAADRRAVLASGLGLGALLVVAAGWRPFRLLGHLAAVNVFIAFLWLTVPFAAEGQAVFTIGHLSASREGIAQALQVTMKCNAIALIAFGLLATIDAVALGRALSDLRAPAKLVHVLLFTVRYGDILHREYHRLVCAMKVRCFRPGTNRHTYRTYGYLVGMLLVNSFDRAERVLAAMKCRGFRGRYYILQQFKIGPGDLAFSIAAGAAALLLGYMQWGMTAR